MKKPEYKVYHVDVKIEGLTFRLYFPSAQMRKIFRMMNQQHVTHCGRRPLIATADDLVRTRLNLAFYEELKSFVPVWDAFVK
jgi:hypothetical protein